MSNKLVVQRITDNLYRITFRDFLGNRCLLQQSLNPTNPKIIFGPFENLEHEAMAQMSLDVDTVKLLLPFLIRFVNENKLFDEIPKDVNSN